jgi:hypothetical protein
MTAPPMFALDGAVKRHGTLVALAPMSLSIASGERVAVIGPSVLTGCQGRQFGPDCGGCPTAGGAGLTPAPRSRQRLVAGSRAILTKPARE